MLETNGRLPAVILTKTSGTIGKASVSTAIKTEPPPHHKTTVNFAEKAQLYRRTKKRSTTQLRNLSFFVT